jgi:hypothetical protein
MIYIDLIYLLLLFKLGCVEHWRQISGKKIANE